MLAMNVWTEREERKREIERGGDIENTRACMFVCLFLLKARELKLP